MAVNRWLGRVLCVLVVVLFGLESTVRADHFLTHPAAPDAQTPNARKSTQVAPSHTKTRQRTAEELFESGIEVDSSRDANVYITPRNIPKNDRFLKAYSANKARQKETGGITTPGLLSIAAQTYRVNDRTNGKRAYTLADAMRDTIWRKNTSAKLKTLLTFHSAVCASGAAPNDRGPSIDFRSGC
jgi:hypothetical protein